MSDTWASRLYQSIRNYRIWPQFYRCTPPLVTKPAVDTDDEIEFYSDMRYLQCLADAVLDDCRMAQAEAPDIYDDWVAKPLLAAASIPVESQRFWDEFGEWPVDYAQHLLTMWRFDRDLEAWMDGEVLA